MTRIGKEVTGWVSSGRNGVAGFGLLGYFLGCSIKKTSAFNFKTTRQLTKKQTQ